MRKLHLILIVFFMNTILTVKAQAQLKYTYENGGYDFVTPSGEHLKITPYGKYIVRIQTRQKNEEFYPNSRYEMVESHNWKGELKVIDKNDHYELSDASKSGIVITLKKSAMTLSFFKSVSAQAFLTEKSFTNFGLDTIKKTFVYDEKEHFTGLGHGYYGREESIDLKDRVVNRNYGTEHGQQAPLIVPYYLSNKGYGIFLNSTFPNEFNFGHNNNYEFSIQGGGQMDYFVILGPDLNDVLNRYTQLTGRPRLPLKSFFGLALSDKGNDHTSTDPSDENWWKNKIIEHRRAGLPIDHIINDNRWRAGGGQRCLSNFDWDRTRYPDPKEFQSWVKSMGLIVTLDFNRCIAEQSEGWQSTFNLPQNEGIDFKKSAPDFTKKEVRDWFWNLMWQKTLNPSLNFPGDALWIDEFDEMGKAPLSMPLENGTTWREMRNYWFFLIAKALVKDGWDKSFNGTKRSFVWIRGMTSGAQRYATMWSGDINSTYEDMKTQVRGMQLAGLSGFPFWGHDAGGFHLGDSKDTPDDDMYRQWSMAFGSFTPFWKPHGIGKSRWPLDRSISVQSDVKKYATLRYELIPYIYTYAHQSNISGIPLAKAMLLNYPNEAQAWQSDLQYMWGNELLVAPNCSINDKVSVWLPKGNWYDFWSDEKLAGDRVINYTAPIGTLPLFVKEGSIIPKANYALTTSAIANDSLNVHVYPGKNAYFNLYEDDGISEAYKKNNEKATTVFSFNQASFTLKISPVEGTYKNAPLTKSYTVIFHNIKKLARAKLNGIILNTISADKKSQNKKAGISWNKKSSILTVYIPQSVVSNQHVIKLEEIYKIKD
jgi:alpha-D-xyloside xylohydrolase